MATITVKNIPEELYRQLKKQATANRRSINSEIIVCIEQAVTARPIDPDIYLIEARRLRALTADTPLDAATIDKAKRAGRP